MNRILLFLLTIFSISAICQSQQVQGWIDDNHYLWVENGDQFKVNARTGAQETYESPSSITDQLPSHVNRFFVSLSEDGTAAAYAHEDDLYLWKDGFESPLRLTADPAEEQNPTFSPDGQFIAYTKESNLYVYDLDQRLEKELTHDGSDLVYNGWASWVYFEEILGRRSRYKAFYWSPDSRHIAYLQFDDHPVPEFPIYWADGRGDAVHGDLEVTRYPKSGDPNPHVRLGVLSLDSEETVWVEEDAQADIYTAWCFWTPDGSSLIFQELNRDQNNLTLYSTKPGSGEKTLMFEEKSPTWVNWYTNIHFLDQHEGFLLVSERGDGWESVYHHGDDGSVIRRVTDVPWRVSGIEWIDEENSKLYFTGTGGHNTERHLFSVGLDGQGLEQLTEGAGTHQVQLSPGGSFFIDRFSNIVTPTRVDLFDNLGRKVRTLQESDADANAEAGIKVEHFTINVDGFELPAVWALPPDFDPAQKYPIVFNIYGGPDAGSVSNRYRNFSNDPLVEQNVIWFSVDHRASGKFGKKGVDYMHRNLGKWEMHDYIEVVKWLREQGFIDETRVGIQGGSYGGYMTALALTYGADYFTHGVSRAPVTTWHLYDNVYTERYMDEPKDNVEGYEFGSVMTHADKFKGELLLIHGETDDNVHMQNTMQLVSKLQDLGKDFGMMIYPNNRHGIRGKKGQHARDLGVQFWQRHFGNWENMGRVIKP